MHASEYPPLNTLKPVAENIWIVDGPIIRFFKMPFSTRMTVIRLENGDLLLHSPIAPNEALISEITKLGRVAHLISPNWIHYAYIGEWAKIFPDATCWASPNVRKKAKKYSTDIEFDEDLGEAPDPAWASEVDQIIVHGSKIHVEVVFFHKPSKTLILTDLIENFEPAKVSFWMRLVYRMAGILDPNGQMPKDMRSTFRDRVTMRQAIDTIISWAPEKIILAHGRWYEQDGVKELNRAFNWLLK